MNDGTTRTLKASDGGGVATVIIGEANFSKNTVLVDPSTSNINNQMTVFAVTNIYYNTPIDPTAGARFEQKVVKNNVVSSLFHEIGDVIYKGASQDHVIDYENNARKQTGLSPRPYDETHNRTVTAGQYGN